MKLSRRRLNRTLLHRQHLLERTSATPYEMAHHLVGLQAQENLPPYLSLAARLEDFDPYDVTRGLEDRSLVRFLVMRGTVHLLTADDALVLREWTAPVHEREIRISQNVGGARDVDRDAFGSALSELLADGPLPQKAIGAALAERFPEHPATQLGQLARSAAPLVQVPPRGTWKGSGGVVYQYVDRWLGRPIGRARRRGDRPPLPEGVRAGLGRGRHRLVRRHPARPGGQGRWTTWSTYEDENGKVLYDVPDGELADEDVPAPVRLLGAYDNVWLSHAARDRVTDPEARTAWMAENGASALLAVRRRLDRRPVEAGGRPGHGPADAADADEAGAGRSSTRRSPGSRRYSPADQRGVRDSSAATAATPAVEVRSTSSPRRTTTAPAPVKAATSSSVSPPSGPTTTTTRPDAGTSSAGQGRGRVLVQDHGQVGGRR